MAVRQPARRGQDQVGFYRRATRATTTSFETRNDFSQHLDSIANRGRERNGGYMRKADQNRLRTTARQIRNDAISRSQNNYTFGTREEQQAQHRATYRNIRRSFGLSAG